MENSTKYSFDQMMTLGKGNNSSEPFLCFIAQKITNEKVYLLFAEFLDFNAQKNLYNLLDPKLKEEIEQNY